MENVKLLLYFLQYTLQEVEVGKETIILYLTYLFFILNWTVRKLNERMRH
jgi:hypothetical protein